MKMNVRTQPIADFTGDTIIVNIFQGAKTPVGATAAVDHALGGLVSRLIIDKEITGDLGETTVIHRCNNLKAKKVIVVGLGKHGKFDLEGVRRAAGAAAKKARDIGAKNVGSVVHGAGIGDLDGAHAAQALAEGTILSLYRFSEYKRPDRTQKIKTFSIVEQKKTKAQEFAKAIVLGKILADSQNIARDLINEPANNLTPEKLLMRVEATLSALHLGKIVTCQYLGQKMLKKMGMNALLAVGQGSSHEAKFIVLRIKTADKPLTCLIGKTVTFDSGGISIKPSSGMGLMKGDMAGGAVAIGATLALAKSRTKVNLLTLIPAVENMPSGSAYRPGDVVRAMSGKTIEIVSTDAEGRLTLADALAYGEKKGARVIVDIATLTGGCVVALGTSIAAVMGNDRALTDRLLEITKRTGEPFWQLPLHEEYRKQIKSEVADLKNSGGRYASTITAGLFLQSFVNKAKWLHIDVAGKELTDKESYYTPVGGTGFGVRTLYELMVSL
jgi:leucyl aminopeptidase